ncbi:uncharacterized protein LOC130668928 isoform X2 [Microplitis mediator]|uniref:uncharacterized protein LOC130668928 isoform X2 n=1 Tax=Microplitis mediator TaxID=375433 RepID=UPI002555E391|nr:uncharacterized protein LOC130668928 isoform X2 [Microplitis mediator]
MLRKISNKCNIIYLFLLLVIFFIGVSNGGGNNDDDINRNKETVKSRNCGGYFTSLRGIISTPNFPRAFSVPIKCHWVIDATEIQLASSNIDNITIAVYLTQLYVYKGLRITEYAYYESPESTNFGATVLKDVTESNVFEDNLLKTNRPFVVIEFELERLEGNHVRVLHNLLDVYGFNLTYEITTPEAININSCSVKNCSFAGNCIIDSSYSKFKCHCFNEFSGKDCSYGPLCISQNNKDINHRSSICYNGGTCSHIGAEYIKCHCRPGYTGDYCEIPIIPNDNQQMTAIINSNEECQEGTPRCIFQCLYIEKNQENNRPCNNCKRQQQSTSAIYNRARYEFRIKLANTSSLIRSTSVLSQTISTLESLLKKQLTKYLKNNADITIIEDLKVQSVTPSGEVLFMFFGISTEGDKIRDALNRLVQRRRLNDFVLESTHLTFKQKPSLQIKSLEIINNPKNTNKVRLGDELYLKCVVQGSSEINFLWYKDDILVNVSKSIRAIEIQQEINDETYTFTLVIPKATLLDAGYYTCQAIDSGLEQCKSIYINVKDGPPHVKILPMSATIDKGNSIQLMCITSPNKESLDIGFGWTKNRALLKLEPGHQVWEDLYPAGSILKIMNAQKSAIYTCNVAHRSMSVRVDVINRTLVPICRKESTWGMRWPDTGPGSTALLECPRQFTGDKVSRICAMKDATTPMWQIPDFSECLYQPLIYPYTKFRSLTLGYQNTTTHDTIIGIWEILSSRELSLYPGEADGIIDILAEIEQYAVNKKQINSGHDSAKVFMQIINRILADENSILRRQLLMQQLVQRTVEYWGKNTTQQQHLALPSLIIDIQPFYVVTVFSSLITETKFLLQIPTDDFTYPYWYNDKVEIRLIKQGRRRGEESKLFTNGTSLLNGAIILYKNITSFLPTAYVKELEDGTDLEYHFNSRVITVAIVEQESLNKKQKIDLSTSKMEIVLTMGHLHQNQSLLKRWNVSCGVEDLSTGSWDFESCITLIAGNNQGGTQCICSRPGTFAVFLTTHAIKVVDAKSKPSTFIVLLGCSSCLLQCTMSSVILGIILWKRPTWLNFLKLQTSSALIGAMSIFVYATCNIVPEIDYARTAVTLEAFLLIGMAAPISQALIVYADITYSRRRRLSRHFQPTVIGVITGLPILCILTTELTHNTSTGRRHESWWLIFGGGVYSIFVSCVATMLLIFMLLYTGVLHRAHAFTENVENLSGDGGIVVVKNKFLQQRVRIINHAAIIICNLILVEVASMFYINYTSEFYHYLFASVSAYFGFGILILNIGSPEIELIAPIFQQIIGRKNVEKDMTTTTTMITFSDPAKVNSKIPVESAESIPPASSSSATASVFRLPPSSYIRTRGVVATATAGSNKQISSEINNKQFLNNSSLPPCSSNRRDIFLPEIRINYSDNINLETYSTSPRKYQESITNTFNNNNISSSMPSPSPPPPPEFYHTLDKNTTTFNCDQLGTAGGSIDRRRSNAQQVDYSSECIPKVLCNADIESRINVTMIMPDVTLAAATSTSSSVDNVVEEKCLDDYTINVIPDIASTSEQQQQQQQHKCIRSNSIKEEENPEITITDCDNTTSNTITGAGMLDRISHDLDYLLNR